MPQYYVDRAPSSLGKLERTPQGGYKAPAKLARVGVMAYDADNMRKQGLPVPKDKFPSGSSVRVYTPPDVIQAAMDTLRACPAPVTNDHPAQMVTTANYRQVTCGAHIDATLAFDGTYLSSDLALQDAGLLADIDSNKKREVSMGYYAETEIEAGKTEDGLEFDARRTAIAYNHIAIVGQGRAGSRVCIALDSDEIPTQQEETPVKLKIKGVEVDATQAAIDALEGELAALKTELDKAQKAANDAQTALATATSDEAISAEVAKREAKAKADKEKADRLAAVKDAYGLSDEDLKDKSEGYVDGMYATLKTGEEARARLKGEIKDTSKKDPDVNDAAPVLTEREKMKLRNQGVKV